MAQGRLPKRASGSLGGEAGRNAEIGVTKIGHGMGRAATCAQTESRNVCAMSAGDACIVLRFNGGEHGSLQYLRGRIIEIERTRSLSVRVLCLALLALAHWRRGCLILHTVTLCVLRHVIF